MKKSIFGIFCTVLLLLLAVSCDTGSPAAPIGPPSGPQGLVLQVVNETSVLLTWTDAAEGETGYSIYWSTDAAKPVAPNTQIAADSTSFTAGGLTPLTLTHFWVTAYDDNGESEAATGSIMPGPVPLAPAGLLITSSDTGLSLSWTDNSTDETGFNVYWSQTGIKPAGTGAQLAAGTVSYAVPGLSAYTSYHFWVEAYNGYGASTDITAAGAFGAAPLAPTDLTVTGTTYRIDLAWTDNAANESSYEIFISTDGNKSAASAVSLPAGATSYGMTQILANTTYSVWVEAKNIIGSSADASGSASTLIKSFKELWVDGGGTVHMAIFTLGDETGFNFYWSDSASTMGTAHPVTATSGAGSDLHYWELIGGLDSSKTWYFWAEALKGPDSLLVSGTIGKGPLMTDPLICTVIGDNQVNLEWMNTTGESGYGIYWSTTDTRPVNPGASVPADVGAYSVTGLDPGTTYYFWVAAFSQGIGGNGFPGAAVANSAKTTGINYGPNLAQNMTATASSGTAGLAVDGNTGTRWETDWAGAGATLPAWITIDFGSNTSFRIVKFRWEAAYAKSYQIQVSTNGTDFTNVYSTTSGGGDITTHVESVDLGTAQTARYIRMYCTERGLGPYGPSLWEFEVYNPL
jgi:hypothetical protein